MYPVDIVNEHLGGGGGGGEDTQAITLALLHPQGRIQLFSKGGGGGLKFAPKNNLL